MKLSVGRADLAKKIIQMIVLTDSYYGDVQLSLGGHKIFVLWVYTCLSDYCSSK